MRSINKFSIIAIFIACMFVFQKTAYAFEPNSKVVSPSSFFYPVIRIIEKGSFYLKFNDQAKMNYYNKLLEKRISELEKVSGDKDKIDYVEPASRRIAANLGSMTEIVDLTASLGSFNPPTEEKISDYKSYLTAIRDKYEYDSGYWLSIQHSIDSFDILLNKINDVKNLEE